MRSEAIFIIHRGLLPLLKVYTPYETLEMPEYGDLKFSESVNFRDGFPKTETVLKNNVLVYLFTP